MMTMMILWISRRVDSSNSPLSDSYFSYLILDLITFLFLVIFQEFVFHKHRNNKTSIFHYNNFAAVSMFTEF
jgi:hypothetical protein